MLAPRLSVVLEIVAKKRYERQLGGVSRVIEPLLLPIIWVSQLWLALLIAAQVNLPLQLINLVVSLLTAWVVIRFSASLVRDPVWSQFVAILVWTLAALNILNLLEPSMELLDHAAIKLVTCVYPPSPSSKPLCCWPYCCGLRPWSAAHWSAASPLRSV